MLQNLRIPLVTDLELQTIKINEVSMSNIDLIILGMIKQHPQSAYEIQKNMKYRNISKWVKVSVPSIYKKVLRLEEKGYISKHRQKDGNMPDKSVYTIKEKGNAYFLKLMNEVSKKEVNVFLDFNAVIVNLELVSDSEKREYIKNIKLNIIEHKNILYKNLEERQHIPSIGKEIFNQQINLIESLEKWIGDLEESL